MLISPRNIGFPHILFVLLLSLCHNVVDVGGQCPTMGMESYVIISLTKDMDTSDMIQLLNYYAKLVPEGSIHYNMYFGSMKSADPTTPDFAGQIQTWIDSHEIHGYFVGSLVTTNNTDIVQYDDGNLMTTVEQVLRQIASHNSNPASAVLKKQVVVLTDYVNLNVTEMLNNAVDNNFEVRGLFHELNTSLYEQHAKFPVFSSVSDLPKKVRDEFVNDLEYVFPSTIQSKSPADTSIFILGNELFPISSQIFSDAISGSSCQVPTTTTFMANEYVRVLYSNGTTINRISIPWVGYNTEAFGKYCLQHYDNLKQTLKSPDRQMKNQLIDHFVSHLHTNNSLSFSFILIGNDQKSLDVLENRDLKTTHSFTVFADLPVIDLYANFTEHLKKDGVISPKLDHAVMPIVKAQQYNANYSTVCREKRNITGLNPSTPYHRPKHFYLAVDDMIWMTVCAGMSAVCVGYLIYQKSKAFYIKQIDLLNEIAMQPLQYKAAKESAKMARLPWEIKSDRVHIDKEFLLGEGTISNVYLGRLKGKAPIMQWIDRVEMKQFQDCAVAVRVPRQFDEPEEDQLFREIASMRRLRSHGHIALFLGWTSKENLVCSLLELTHMNLLKYLGQLKETFIDGTPPHTSQIPYKQLYQIVWQICDGMSYLHSRNLIHRDLAARNILLTTGLRAKISGFGFCSDPEDPKFSAKSPTLKSLPARWLAPEAFRGRFTQYSDVWSFGVLLFEAFSLGDLPYSEITSLEAVQNAVQKGRILQQPRFSTRNTYIKMQKCFNQYPERRPNFTQLRAACFDQYEQLHDNPAFQTDD